MMPDFLCFLSSVSLNIKMHPWDCALNIKQDSFTNCIFRLKQKTHFNSYLSRQAASALLLISQVSPAATSIVEHQLNIARIKQLCYELFGEILIKSKRQNNTNCTLYYPHHAVSLPLKINVICQAF